MSGLAMEMRLRPPLSSLHPPLSATTGENGDESGINRFRVKLNIRFEFSAMRELAQKVGGGSPLSSCFEHLLVLVIYRLDSASCFLDRLLLNCRV